MTRNIHGVNKKFFYIIGKFIFYFLFKIFTKIEVIGKENPPEKGPLIVVSNHKSILDPMILMVTLPYNIKFLAASYLFKIPFLNIILKITGMLPVKEKKEDLKTLKKAIDLLKEGKVIGVFPEGGVSINEEVSEFKPGFAFLSLKTKAPILPVAIVGSNKVLPPGKWIPKRARIKVFIGKPIFIEKLNVENKKEMYIFLANYTREVICKNLYADPHAAKCGTIR